MEIKQKYFSILFTAALFFMSNAYSMQNPTFDSLEQDFEALKRNLDLKWPETKNQGNSILDKFKTLKNTTLAQEKKYAFWKPLVAGLGALFFTLPSISSYFKVPLLHYFEENPSYAYFLGGGFIWSALFGKALQTQRNREWATFDRELDQFCYGYEKKTN
jgi:hypothetical protein